MTWRSRDRPSCIGFKEFWALVPAKFGSERQMYRVFQVKCISDMAREYFEFPTVGETSAAVGTIINQPLTEIREGEEDG